MRVDLLEKLIKHQLQIQRTTSLTSEQLKSARQALGWSQEDMANELRTTGRTVRRWEAGSRKIPGSVSRLIDYLLIDAGIDPDEFFGK